MNGETAYEYLERIANLIRTDIRRSGLDMGLQPVHIEALHYLSRCNRYSNTPLAVAEFLGLTKGTVSQTIGVLEAAGLLQRQPDARDRRVVHLTLSELGEAAIARYIPPSVFKTAVESIPDRDGREITDLLDQFLRQLQQANRSKSFGACMTCRHHLREGGSLRRCALTTEILSETESGKICREHQFVDAGSAVGAPSDVAAE